MLVADLEADLCLPVASSELMGTYTFRACLIVAIAPVVAQGEVEGWVEDDHEHHLVLCFLDGERRKRWREEGKNRRGNSKEI